MNYSDKIRGMKVAELRTECAKYPEIEISPKDNKDELIEKLLAAYYTRKAEEPKQYINADIASNLGTVYKKDAPIGLDGPMKEEDFLLPYQIVEKELMLSKSAKKILKAQLYSYTTLKTGEGEPMVFFVGMMEDCYRQILVPFDEYRLDILENVEDGKDRSNNRVKLKNKEKFTQDEIKKYFNRRNRTTFEFVVEGKLAQDPFTSVIASRKKAATINDKRFWKLWVRNEDGEEDYWIAAGRKMEARIMEVESYGIIVETLGKEFFIPKKELTYTMRENLKTKFIPGDTIKLIVKDIRRDEQGNVEALSFSHKELLPNPIHIVERMYEGLIVNGYVVDQEYSEEWGYRSYVACNGIEIMSKMNASNTMLPVIGDYVSVKIDKIKPETGQVRGYILHIHQNAKRG